MSYEPQANVTIHLSRINGQIPWGFRMSGGTDYSGPLTIQRVTPGTIAANCGVQPNDMIVQINGVHTGLMKHKDAQQAIISSGNNVTLGLSRKHEVGKAVSPVPQRQSYPEIPAPRDYIWRRGNPPPSPGHADAYQAPGLAYQSKGESLVVPGFAPECPDTPLVRHIQREGAETVVTINVEKQSRSHAVGSYAQPTFSAQPGPAPASVSAAGYSPVQAPKPAVYQVPRAPAPQPAYHPPAPVPVQSPTSRPGYHSPAPPPVQAPAPLSPKPVQLSPAVKQQAPKPWVPEGGKVSDIQCGDKTAHRGTSTYYNAPLEPGKVPFCNNCTVAIRGPFIVALNKCWCPKHFTCAKCQSQLIDMGFVELNGHVYCEKDYEIYFAPKCAKCDKAIMGDTVNALKKTWHKTCFVCLECSCPITSGAFHVEDGRPYCLNDWQRLFQTKCAGCEFPVEPGDRWIEALDTNWHSECFVCNVCNTSLEGKAFFARDGRPFCKGHAGAGAR